MLHLVVPVSVRYSRQGVMSEVFVFHCGGCSYRACSTSIFYYNSDSDIPPFASAHRPTRLQEADLEVLEASRCEDIFRREQFLPQLRLRYPELLQGKSIFCASYPERSACQVGFLPGCQVKGLSCALYQSQVASDCLV